MGILNFLFGGKEKAPDAGEVAREQGRINQETLAHIIASNQVDQQNPWGQQTWSGAGPNRKLTTTLNPMDQQNLDARRGIGQNLLAMIMGGQMPQMPQAQQQGTPPIVPPEVRRRRPMWEDPDDDNDGMY